ncbi:MAG: hypothetical protein HYY64_05305 [Candidatus Rokubacteria bacterium]|nr:hypothetical protein [Candidatus Rokubacteria bacterium]
MQTALIRCRLLLATIIVCINEQTGPGLYLAARALFETTGLVACLLLHLRRYYANEESYDEFERVLRRLSLGQRWEPLRDARGESLQPVNALTLVESIATLLAEILGDPEAKKHTMASYEVLSEYCHPNRAGRRAGVRFSSDKLEATYEMAPRFSAEDIAATLPAAGTVLLALFAAHEESLRLLSTHEEMPTLER